MQVIVLHSVVPVRVEPSERAEMCTQLLFAETALVLEETQNWMRVRNDADGYEGWVDKKMVSGIEKADYRKLQQAPYAVVAMPVAMALSQNNQTTILLTGGTHLPNYQNGVFELLGVKFSIDASLAHQPQSMMPETFLQTARFFLNCPYLWGGKNTFGMDCSGFTQVLFGIFGRQLPRDASQQVQEGNVVNFLQEVQTGDLAFFENAEGKIIHVGIFLDSQRIMHCSGRVKIDKIDSQGIISSETGMYTHTLRVIKRIG